MHLKTLSLLALTAHALETHGGYDFETRFTPGGAPETGGIKDSYESVAAAQAASHLREQMRVKAVALGCLTEEDDASDDTQTPITATTTTSPADLYALKECIAKDKEDNFYTLLADDIKASDAFWGKVVDESTKDRGKWVAARSYNKAYFDGSLTALQFAAWTLSPAADRANMGANPEHYHKSASVVNPATGEQSSSILEGWGGVLSPSLGTKRSNFTVPSFTTPNADNTPAEWAIGAEFPLAFQRVGEKVLSSNGKTFGVLQIAVRDFDAAEGKKKGIEVYSAVWYPPWDGAQDEDVRKEFLGNHLADEAHHMVVEVINLTLKAREDCEAGGCVIPGM
ncbi:hypothetical protein F5Y17DRAFT_363443 [Xylariaceae sp. FL0594]|nr:hypothetical protein F5Y17DRAFT_363443 [Xylariaceae sp. FL0594]